MTNRKFCPAGLCAALILSLFFVSLVSPAGAQGFTAADSGWVRVFNGVDFNGFYSRLYAAPVTHPVDTSAFSIVYPGTDTACIRAKNTSKKGELGTDRTDYSHYRTRMEYRFDVASSGYNAGLLYGVDESKIRMQNNWPRGFEFQMQQSEPGAVYSIQQVTADTKVTSGRYSPSGSPVKVCEYGCNARSYKGTVDIPSAIGTTPKWMRIELIQRGADSAIHIVNDTVVMKIWNIRIFNDSTKTTGSTSSGQTSMSNFTPNGPYPSGALAVEGEGALINHRRWDVMEFPASTPMNENYLHRLFLDVPASIVRYQAGGTVNFSWRSIGTIPKVKIEYRLRTSALWQVVADSVPNSGSYAWVMPNLFTDSLHFRISSLDYVWGDSTGNPNTTAIRRVGVSAPGIRLSVRNGILTIPNAQNYDRVEVRNASGLTVRAFRGGRLEQVSTVSWDLRDRSGGKVPPGLYFLKLTGPLGIRTASITIF